MIRVITLGVIGALVLGLALWLFVIRQPDTQQETTSKSTSDRDMSDITNGVNLVLGNKDAPNIIVEYGDYKCPNCAKFHIGSYVELKRDYLDTGKAKIIFKNTPYIAKDSRVAADGTYCANEQDLFPAYHEGVYDYMSDLYEREGLDKEFKNILTPKFLGSIIKRAGGNVKKFTSCIKKKKYKKLVDEDLHSSEVNQISGTPTFIIDQRKIVGAQPITIFRTLLEAG
jgi:protein-disulfide isomerase